MHNMLIQLVLRLPVLEPCSAFLECPPGPQSSVVPQERLSTDLTASFRCERGISLELPPEYSEVVVSLKNLIRCATKVLTMCMYMLVGFKWGIS